MNKMLIRIAIIAVVVMFVISTGAVAGAEQKSVRESGLLTSVEEDGSVIINEHGYFMAPFARIIDGFGKKVHVRDLEIPTKVEFEFESTPKGAVIKYLRVIPE